MTNQTMSAHHDAIVIGAGFAGLYMVHKLREEGRSVIAFEAGDDVGGTWYWNRYPGARCDVESTDYVYSFAPEVSQEWDWEEKYPAQPDVLRYLQHVADTFDLRRYFHFSTRVTSASYDEGRELWRVSTDTGQKATARYLITAAGCLSAPNFPSLPGLDGFQGELYHTGLWPHHEVTFAGKNVGVLGTGSSGVQATPAIAESADHLFVFQRTPTFSVPARNAPLDPEEQRAFKERFVEHKAAARYSTAGLLFDFIMEEEAEKVPPETREKVYWTAWEQGGPLFIRGTFTNILRSLEANETAAEFLRDRIEDIVEDPDVAAKLKPYEYPIGSKRICVDTDYYNTFNRDNVTLVDFRSEPLETVLADGIRTSEGTYKLDVLVLATGFDALTGALNRIDIRGIGGKSLKDAWQEGPRTYLGLCTRGFPNLFMITGPQSPSVFSNMVMSIEQHVDLIADCLLHMSANGFRVVQPTEQAEEEWGEHVNEVNNQTLFPHANSWYMGANIPGKKRVMLPYAGGVGEYRRQCERVVEAGWVGFEFDGMPVGTSPRSVFTGMTVESE